jgi:hypothetical protein
MIPHPYISASCRQTFTTRPLAVDALPQLVLFARSVVQERNASPLPSITCTTLQRNTGVVTQSVFHFLASPLAVRSLGTKSFRITIYAEHPVLPCFFQKCPSVSPLDSALTRRRLVSPLESALTKNTQGGGVVLTSRCRYPASLLGGVPNREARNT